MSLIYFSLQRDHTSHRTPFDSLHRVDSGLTRTTSSLAAQVHAVHLEQAKALEQAQETQSLQQMGELARRYAALEERMQTATARLKGRLNTLSVTLARNDA